MARSAARPDHYEIVNLAAQLVAAIRDADEETRNRAYQVVASRANDSHYAHTHEPYSAIALAFQAQWKRDAYDNREVNKERDDLADRANQAAEASRRRGAPELAWDSTAEQVAAWLQWNDPNGSHTAALAEREGADPYTDETAWAALEEALADAVPAKQPARVRVVMRDDTPLGIPSGKTIWHVEVQSSGDVPFTGCPLGRSTAGEEAAIRDLVRPGYALPYGTTVTAADVLVVERQDLRTAKGVR